MAKRSIQVASTSVTAYVLITDVNGSPITGLVYNSTSLASKYVLPLAASVAITLATQTVTGAWSSGGFVEVDSTACPGLYRFDIPNAAFASGNGVIVSLYGYSGMSAMLLEFDLWAVNPQDATRMGMTALPNANAGTNGGLPLSVDASGRVDVLKINGTSQTARDIGASVLLSTGTGTGQLDFTSGVVKANLAQILGTALTETAGLLAGGFKKFFNVASPTLTCLGIDQTGDSYARIGATGSGLTTITALLPSALVGGRIDASVGAYQTGLTPLQPATAGRTLVVDAAGLADANAVKVGPTGSGTAQTARDIGSTLGVAGAGLTALGDTRIAHLDADVSSRTKPADTQAAVTTVTNLTNAPTAGDFTATMKTSLNAATPAVTVSDKTGFSLTSAYDPAKTAAQAGDSMALTSGERTTLTAVMWAALTSGLTTVGSIGKRISDYLTGDAYARLGAPDGGSVSADVAAVKVDTAAIKLKTDNLPASPAATGDQMALTAAYDAAKTAAQAGDPMTLTSGERDSIAAALLDLSNGIETGYTLRQSQRIMFAALAGKLSGANSALVIIRDVNDTKDRITATVDNFGDRSAVTLDAS